MSLVWNIKRLLDASQGEDSAERVRVEYHVLSWRELYDKSILTLDRYSSGAGEWVVQGGPGFFNVTVVSYPYYVLPQRLCLSFECATKTSRYERAGRQTTVVGPPIESVALDLIALLSVFAREPLVPLGARRVGDKPRYELPLNAYPPRAKGLSRPPPLGIDSPEFVAILQGLAEAPDGLVNAVMGAAKFYHAGLSVVALDMSVGYTSLVSAIECLAGYHFKGAAANFEEIEKFDRVRELLDYIAASAGAETLVAQLKVELLKRESFLRKNFVGFLADFAPQSFWDTPDPIYGDASVFPPITAENFERCLRAVYDQRSAYLHGGTPFPQYSIVGLRNKVPHAALLQSLELEGKGKYVPPFVWFERLVHLATVEYLCRSLAPVVARAKREQGERRARLVTSLSDLPENVQSSLRKLTEWTAQFLPYAMLNPEAPNRAWADCVQTIETLKTLGLIDGEGEGLEGLSWLRDRDVGEAVGEHFFGVADNPFRDSQLLLPSNTRDLTADPPG